MSKEGHCKEEGVEIESWSCWTLSTDCVAIRQRFPSYRREGSCETLPPTQLQRGCSVGRWRCPCVNNVYSLVQLAA